MNLNKILITGNLTADPELRYTPNGKAVLSASLANNEYYTDAQGQEQKVTTFVNLEVWNKPAENFSKLVKKGQELFAEGKRSITIALPSPTIRPTFDALRNAWRFSKRPKATRPPKRSFRAESA